jgi:nitrate/nitrite transporter NarK
MVAIWFPPREVGLATGLCLTGMGVSIAAILAIGAAFSTWQQTMLNVGIIISVVTFLWILLFREAPARGRHVAERVRVVESLAYNFKQRNTWLISIAQFLIMGSFPHMLVHVHGISPAIAGAKSSAIIFAMVGGNIIGPAVSDRIGLRKPVFNVAMAVTAICVFFGWLTAMSTTT